MLVNLLIVPVQPLILVSGTLALAAGIPGTPLVPQALLWVAWLGLSWTERVVTLAARLPWADMAVTGYGPLGLALTYGAIVALHTRQQWRRQVDAAVAHLPRPARASPRLSPRLLVALALAAALLAAAWWRAPDGSLHVHFLDVGQGDAIFIQTPRGRQVLIDGGADGQTLFNQLGQVMPFWDRSLDLVIASHPDTDHIGGLVRVPERLRVAAALESPSSQADPAAQSWRAALHAAGTPVHSTSQDAVIDLGDGVLLEVLWPPASGAYPFDDGNENSLVLRLVYGDFSALFTGDAGLLSEGRWIDQGLPLSATVLKVGHHGSANSTGARLVAAVDPQFAVISVGAGNTYGHPAAVVLDNLAGVTVYRTDEHGRVSIRTDGAQVWIKTAR